MSHACPDRVRARPVARMPVAGGIDRHALLDAGRMARADAAAIAGGMDGLTLMRRAGAAVTDAVLRELAAAGGGMVTVCAGPGNNGGDGAVVATLLARAGVDVALVRAGGAPRADGDAARAFAECPLARPAHRSTPGRPSCACGRPRSSWTPCSVPVCRARRTATSPRSSRR